MRDELARLLDAFETECRGIGDEPAYRALRERYLSREKGLLTLQLKRLRDLPPAERPGFGQEVNQLKAAVEARLDELERQVRLAAYQDRLVRERLDVTLPGIPVPRGTLHPVKQVEAEICGIFQRMGYAIAEGPEIETDFYNFGALNFPPDHPARDAQDTFFCGGGGFLLRTHTSPVQIRTMQAVAPPLKIIAPGKVYRKDTPDATHFPIFHQIEGLVVDEGVSLADLKGTLEFFARECFAADARIRLRPSFFPFVEPGAEVDVSCFFCGGRGCRICKGSGWIEILGAGMVHPNVFDACGVDSERYTGFAFGMGVDRVAILRYGVPDIRMFWENDVRFLNQFHRF
jgi:phenylalanyl-tRNA synthetase alpha chain